MKNQEIYVILSEMKMQTSSVTITRFCREEDGSPYDVWKVENEEEAAVLKRVSPEELAVYQVFFPEGGGGVPRIYGSVEYGNEIYMLMEFIEGETMSRCTREKLQLALDCLIQIQEAFWGNTELTNLCWNFEKRYAAREKRLPYMDDLSEAYQAYLEADCSIPRTLCNDDLLPFNVLISKTRAVMIDWEYAGILPYPCSIARLLAFGEENEDFIFQMSFEDKKFAVQYYYDNLVKSKGIDWESYIRTMKLFFLKEYCEWVYFARSSNKLNHPYYQEYYKNAKILARDLGYYCDQ